MISDIMIEPKSLNEILEKFKNQKIAVIGDVMLDRYIFGNVERICPEAPVPIIDLERVETRAGGAANVAMNLKSLGCSVDMFSIVGNDDDGLMLKDILNKSDIDTKNLHCHTSRRTTIKTRIIAHNQQMLRVDTEDRDDIDNLSEELLMKNLKDYNVIVVSDYSKGVITKRLMYHLNHLKGCKIIVDPKKNFERYEFCDVITPNVKELELATGMSCKNTTEIIAAAKELRKHVAEIVLVTRGESGMTLVSELEIITIPTYARQVFDVTGAGDTVVATFSLAVASGATYTQATIIANIAAGIVVGQVGTSTTTIDGIKDEYDAILRHSSK
jgi:rfaE bifunctional protein kinase chain/domain